MSTNNLPKLIALEKITKDIIHGDISLDVHVVNGAIATISAKGSKKALFNQSEKDINTNQTAFRYMLERMKVLVESSGSGVVTFTVSTQQNKIKFIKVESTQTIE